MCGIVGVAATGGPDTDGLHHMCDAISHRGPDDAGVEVWRDHGVGLGHRRLSIIDLSPAGHNPMPNEDRSVWLVFNGEIYNFQSLRQELERAGHVFRSRSDTEVVLHAYEEWGDEHVHRLRGMFAYALYDRRPQSGSEGPSHDFRLMLVRDRLGIKPLFYYQHAHLFLFASEIKAILAYPGVDRAIDRSALFDYLTYMYVPAPKTAYTHVRKIPPGHYLVLERDQIRLRQYWDVTWNRPTPARTPDEAAVLVREALAQVVRLHMLSDVPVGVFLSGGVDSSTITALMAQASDEPVRSFTIGFDVAAHSETRYSRLVADRWGTQHCERNVGADSLQDMLPAVGWMYDEPFADGSAVPTRRLAALAREQVKVVLCGDGGDEVFGGYEWYTAWLRRRAFDWVPLVLRRKLFAGLGRSWPTWLRGKQFLADLRLGPIEQYGRLLELFSPMEKRLIIAPEWAKELADYDDYWYFRQYWRDELDPMTRIQYLDLKTYLPDDILTKIDRASMAVSLEARPPLLDHELVEQLFSIPAEWRAPGGAKKYLLKQAARDLLPDAILRRPKKGFSAPWTAWMRSEREWVTSRLQRGDQIGFLRPDVADVPWLSKNAEGMWAALLLLQWSGNEAARDKRCHRS